MIQDTCRKLSDLFAVATQKEGQKFSIESKVKKREQFPNQRLSPAGQRYPTAVLQQCVEKVQGRDTVPAV